jgi:hypothetical protein
LYHRVKVSTLLGKGLAESDVFSFHIYQWLVQPG